jgi:hypothetical protein
MASKITSNEMLLKALAFKADPIKTKEVKGNGNIVEFRDGIAYLQLKGGVEVVLDADDVGRVLSGAKWRKSNRYVVRNAGQRPDRYTEYLHRVVMCEPVGLEVDHISGDRLDNRKQNLRPVTHAQNSQNQVTAGREDMRNVSWSSANSRWVVRLKKDGEVIYGGTFVDLEEAKVCARELRATHYTHHNDNRLGDEMSIDEARDALDAEKEELAKAAELEEARYNYVVELYTDIQVAINEVDIALEDGTIKAQEALDIFITLLPILKALYKAAKDDKKLRRMFRKSAWKFLGRLR